MATIKDVSKLAGVSVATVSRVLNNSGYVKEETKNSIMKAMKNLNYTPNIMARGLAGKNTSTVALLVPDILNPYFPEVARAIEDAANQYGFNLILCNSDNNLSKEVAYIDLLKSKKVDGFIIASYTIQEEQILSLLQEDIPVVAIDRVFSNPKISSYICKNKKGAMLAVEHLLEKGCNKIAHIGGPSYVQSSIDRTAGYEEKCISEGIYLSSLVKQGNFHKEGGFNAMIELLSTHPDIDGVFASNDLMAVGALRAIIKSGRKVPEDVKVIGFDDIPLASTIIPELSSVKQPIYEIGTLAMESLMEMINGNMDGVSQIELDVKVIGRESTG
jgi:LacI family transcriptional regulator